VGRRARARARDPDASEETSTPPIVLVRRVSVSAPLARTSDGGTGRVRSTVRKRLSSRRRPRGINRQLCVIPIVLRSVPLFLSVSLSLSLSLSHPRLVRIRRPDAAETHAPRRRAQTHSGVVRFFLPTRDSSDSLGGGDFFSSFVRRRRSGRKLRDVGDDVATRRRQSAAPGDFGAVRARPARNFEGGRDSAESSSPSFSSI